MIDKKSFDSPDEVRTFDKGKVETIAINGITFGKGTFEPGWKWSESVKPIAKTDSCQAPHTQYQVSGKMHVVMDDGTEAESGPGDIVYISPGHDAWVVGDEPVVVIDVTGMKDYAKPA